MSSDMDRSRKIRTVVVFAAAVLLAAMIGVALCHVGVWSSKTSDGSSSSSSSSSRGSSALGYTVGRAGGRRGHDSDTATAIDLWQGGASPQSWCEWQWEVLMKEAIELFEEVNEALDHRPHCARHRYDKGEKKNHEQLSKDRAKYGHDYYDVRNAFFLVRFKKLQLRTFLDVKCGERISDEKINAILELEYPPRPVNSSWTFSRTGCGTWEKRVDRWMLWRERVVVEAKMVVIPVCTALFSLWLLSRLVKAHAKDPAKGSRYYSKTLEYFVAIGAGARRFVGARTKEQRAVNGS